MITQYSQNAPGLNSIRLGTGSTNKTTIASHGCTVTSIGNAVGLTPQIVNDLFVNRNVYAASKDTPNTFNLVNWTRIYFAIPSLDFEWRGYSYEDDRVKEAINRNGFCLVAVDASPIGGNVKDGHWVLAIGDGKIIDPWDGKEKPFSTYRATGYAILNRVATPPNSGGSMNMYGSPNQYDLSNPESMKIAVDHLNAILTGKYVKVEEVEELKRQAYDEGLNKGKSEARKFEAPEEIENNGKKWVLNGIQKQGNQLVGNYKRKE